MTTPDHVPVTPSLHRFHAYQISLEFRRLVVRWLPLKRAELSDQLDRASLSLSLNIAEGAGRALPRERARYYTIARGSAYECLAVIDLLAIERSADDFSEARILIDRLCAILSKLMRR